MIINPIQENFKVANVDVNGQSVGGSSNFTLTTALGIQQAVKCTAIVYIRETASAFKRKGMLVFATRTLNDAFSLASAYNSASPVQMQGYSYSTDSLLSVPEYDSLGAASTIELLSAQITSSSGTLNDQLDLIWKNTAVGSKTLSIRGRILAYSNIIQK